MILHYFPMFIERFQAPTGGRVTVFQTTLPNIGPGALENRDESGVKSSPKVINPLQLLVISMIITVLHIICARKKISKLLIF